MGKDARMNVPDSLVFHYFLAVFSLLQLLSNFICFVRGVSSFLVTLNFLKFILDV
jgi:hypothetical protein